MNRTHVHRLTHKQFPLISVVVQCRNLYSDMSCILIEAKIQIMCSNAQQPLIYSAFPVNFQAENIPNSSRAVQGELFLFLLHQKHIKAMHLLQGQK